MYSSQAASKLILAGEHAVVYGAPALTTQLNWRTHCQFDQSHSLNLCLAGHDCIQLNSEQLQQHWQQLLQRHQQWQQQANTAIMRQLSDLPLAVLAYWQQRHPLPDCQIHIRSDIPIGQGLGSSASLIVAMLTGLNQLCGTADTRADIQQAATALEQLAHGTSSGLDVAALLHAPQIYWQNKQATPLSNLHIPGYLIFTGTAASSTADCVGWVKQQHVHAKRRWQEMQQQTQQLRLALQEHNPEALQSCVHELHQHLCQLGVVPDKIQAFSQRARDEHASASKICGAGSIRGDAAGFLWLLSAQAPVELCAEFGYDYWPLDQLIVTEEINA